MLRSLPEQDVKDIYLGDASSQVYEFLLTRRPCIFLNSHRHIAYQHDPSFAHWAMGDVIEDVAHLERALQLAVEFPDHYAAVQQKLFQSHINLTDEKSSTRAARAVEQFADGLDEARTSHVR